MAEHIDDMPPRDLTARAEIGPGLEVLDVATGTGHIALRAAAQGAGVVGLDLTPELFATARRRAEALGVAIEWLEGDAEQLPFAAGSFDRVLSAFGVQFAPAPSARRGRAGASAAARRAHRARQLDARRPDWRALQDHGPLPAGPPDYASPPPLWGTKTTSPSSSPAGLELAFARGHNPWVFGSPEHWVAFMETRYGPTVKARERLTAERRWADCRAELVALAERHNRAPRGGLHMEAEHLVTVARSA